MAKLRLLTIGFSHFCEKARWALDRTALEYVEDDHVPLLHWAANRRAGAGRTVPALVTPRGVLRESSEILRFADEALLPERRLFPDALRDEVEPLVAEFDRSLGPAIRRAMYGYLVPNPAALKSMLASTGPRWERATARVGFPLLRAMIVRGLNITPEKAKQSREKIDAIFKKVAERLADGRPYLTGDRFTAADLTLASLSGPAIAPPNYGWPLLAEAERPPEISAYTEALRATPAGQLILRLYAQERPPVRAQSRA